MTSISMPLYIHTSNAPGPLELDTVGVTCDVPVARDTGLVVDSPMMDDPVCEKVGGVDHGCNAADATSVEAVDKNRVVEDAVCDVAASG
jgi:hypothetical protein